MQVEQILEVVMIEILGCGSASVLSSRKTFPCLKVGLRKPIHSFYAMKTHTIKHYCLKKEFSHAAQDPCCFSKANLLHNYVFHTLMYKNLARM